MDQKKVTTIYLEPEQHKILREIAFHQNTTMAELIRQAIDAWLTEKGYFKEQINE